MVALGSFAEQVFACRLSCALELTAYQFERIIDSDMEENSAWATQEVQQEM